MEGVKKKWKELLYSFSTEDHYAEYNSNTSVQGPSASMAADGINGMASSSQIQLTEFVDGGDLGGNDGVSEAMLAWRHIDAWASEHNPDLFATLSDPCTRNDLNNAERDLSITFPASVRASLRLHDGQEDLESLTGTSGLIYGLQLMPLDEIVHMTQTWRNVAENMMKRRKTHVPAATVQGSSVELPNKSAAPQSLKTKGYGKLDSQDYASGNPELQRNISANHNKQFKMARIPRQSSIPPDSIQPVYAHPGWIPLVTDNAGNHIGIDLAPGARGRYAQVILFGRDFDTKFVVAANWGDFLLSFANDLEKGNWYLVDEEDDFFGGEGELVFRDKEANSSIRDYLEVLKSRAWQKWQSSREKQIEKSNEQAQAKDILDATPSELEHESTLFEKSPSPEPQTETKGTNDLTNESIVESPAESVHSVELDKEEQKEEPKSEPAEVQEHQTLSDEQPNLTKEQSLGEQVKKEDVSPAEPSGDVKELKEEFESIAL